MTRYARQMMLPEIGADGQARLAVAHVAIIGAGGLGCPVLQYLAGAGVGHITLYDPDVIEDSNLHRQPLYRISDLGRPKADVAAEFVRGFNPDVAIDAHICALGPSIAADIAETADLVIDAADSFAVSYILSDTCRSQKTPLISASVLGQSGYVGAFCGSAPSLRAVFPDLPDNGATCATAGVLGPAVGTIGALQAQMALRVLLRSDPSPLGRLVTLDLAKLRFGGFAFHGSPEPEQYVPFVAKSMLDDSDQIIELRSEDEVARPIAPSAMRLRPDGLDRFEAPADTRVVLCCRSGLRAWRAASVLQAKGHRQLALLAAQACG
ncbi:HesA/MoeB/ThiF family protein [Gymnodinialimonas sp. 2305UL16-5]|uniref:HesA/MoeB/ThiF family protein n=1 Tax=Gymnodinialimonas mytili TaxID=3126503 RepID=UPI0030A09C1E